MSPSHLIKPEPEDNRVLKPVADSPKEKKTRVTVILTIIVILAFSLLVFSGIKLFSIFSEYHEAREQYQEAADEYTIESSPAEAAVAVPFPINVDFKELRQVCPDIIGWLYFPDTVISYPVAQSTDNDYYLHRYMDGSYLYAGTLFADYECAGDFSGKNTIIYGHHMNDGSMFASLTKYRDQSYYDAHPHMYLATPEGNYTLEIFSAYTTDSASFAYTVNFTSEEEFGDFLATACSLSDIRTSLIPDSDDCVVTLSTCTYNFEDARYIVQGILLPFGSS